MGNESIHDSEFSDAFERAVRVVSRAYALIEGVISSVDEAGLTCTVSVGDSLSSVEYDNVYLDVLLIGQGSFICIPTIGSNCLMSFKGGSEERRQLIKSFNYDKIIASPVAWQFGEGTNGGIPMVNPLVDVINTIIKDSNKLKAAFNAWVVAPNDGGAALKASAAAWSSLNLDPASVDDIENPNVTQ